jgi:glycosyltransferase involved in cell wall biosynthesis
MSLTVLSVAYPFAPVGADAAGGAEQVLSLVDEALVRLGHRSVVIACEGSTAAGRLVATPAAAAPASRAQWAAGHARTALAIEASLARERVDVVHMHGVDFHGYLPSWPGPILVTLHLPASFYPAAVLRDLPPNVTLACVSPSQRRSFAHLRVETVVENGVPVERLGRDRRRRAGFVAAMGRICPEKGFHLALDAARRAGVACLLAGRLFAYDTHVRYFEREIAPRLDALRRFVGPAGFDEKRKLLAEARCLLVPSLAAETSSLVAMEALACGTPVVAFRAGALPDIVEHGRTGYLVDDVEEMAAAIGAAPGLDPDACRAAARARFSAEGMVHRYLSLYESLARPGGRQRGAS